MSEAEKGNGHADDVAAVRALLTAETQFSAAVRVPRDAPAEAKAARDEVVRAALAANGFDGETRKASAFDKQMASQAVITKEGDLKTLVSKRDLEDAIALSKGEKLTWATKGVSTVIRKGEEVKVPHEAGDKRSASAVARLLANNPEAIVNRKEGKEGFAAIEVGDKKGAMAYLKVDVLIAKAEESKYPGAILKALKESIAHTRKMTAVMNMRAYEKTKTADKGQSR